MGRINIHLHGVTKEKAYSEMLEVYNQRLSQRNITITSHSDKKSVGDYYNQLNKNSILYILDERGKQYTSIELAGLVKEWGMSTDDVNVAVGPVDGWDQFGVNHSQKRIISLSNMTFPHELASVILAEQIYRSTEILKGTKYHRD